MKTRDKVIKGRVITNLRRMNANENINESQKSIISVF